MNLIGSYALPHTPLISTVTILFHKIISVFFLWVSLSRWRAQNNDTSTHLKHHIAILSDNCIFISSTIKLVFIFFFFSNYVCSRFFILSTSLAFCSGFIVLLLFFYHSMCRGLILKGNYLGNYCWIIHSHIILIVGTQDQNFRSTLFWRGFF